MKTATQCVFILMALLFSGCNDLGTAFEEKQRRYELCVGTNGSHGGSVSPSGCNHYREGVAVSVTASASSGYTFTGWSGASTSTSSSINVTMDKAKSLTANFMQITHTLSVGVSPPSGGTVRVNGNPSLGSTTHNFGANVTVTAEATGGYTFIGWSGASSSTSSSITITMSGDMSLTANFRQITYELTVSRNQPNGGTVYVNGNVSSETTTHNSGSSVTVSAEAASGYTFTGWSGASTSASSTINLTMDGHRSLTANFQQITYTLYVSRSPTNGGTVYVNGSTSSGNTVHALGVQVYVSVEAAPGYEFTGWSGWSSSLSPEINVTMNGDRSLTANFQEIDVQIEWGYLYDDRDGQDYNIVKIGNLWWMAENLNYEPYDYGDNSWCYEDYDYYCSKYGRLYDWEAAMAACPDEWRLPTRAEWNTLVGYAGGDNVAGEKLKSAYGWYYDGNGLDDYGFSAMPGGSRDNGGNFDDVDLNGRWWSATEDGANNAYLRAMTYLSGNVYEYSYRKERGFSVRCVAR